MPLNKQSRSWWFETWCSSDATVITPLQNVISVLQMIKSPVKECRCFLCYKPGYDVEQTSMAADDAAAAGAASDECGPGDVHPALTPFTVLNVRGLKPRTVPSKVPLISDIIYDISHIFIGLTETWLYDHQDAELNIGGFTLFRLDRQRKKIHNRSCYSGGVALYVNDKDAIDSEIILTFSNRVIEALGIHIKSRNLVQCCCDNCVSPTSWPWRETPIRE